MSRSHRILSLFAVATLLVLGACRDAAPPGARLTVSIPPQAWLVERLAGADRAVDVALAPGESPAVFDPTPRRLAELSGTALYLAVGVPMEHGLLDHLRSAVPDMKIVDLSRGLTRLSAHGHSHDHGDADHASDLDPHVWLSPRLMARMAKIAAEALAEDDPARAGEIRANLEAVQAELIELDADLARILAPTTGHTMLVYHPAYGYLAHDYGFTQLAVEEHGLPPSPRHLAELLDGLRDEHPRAVFVQPQAESGPLRALAEEAGLAVEVIDPLAHDYPENLRRMATAIAAALAPDESAAP